MRRRRRVDAGEVSLEVLEAGEPGRTPVLLVHGFPDCHAVYDHVIDDLARDFHVATFDLRGVAGSTAPPDARGYRIDAILPDLTAVIDAVFGPSATVHLVGHDWGSVLGFSYVAEGADRARIRSFTSASGPHVRLMWDAALRNAASNGARAAIAQAAASWYVFAMHVPVLPEALLRLAGPALMRWALVRALRPPQKPARRSIEVPIRLIVPTRDPFVKPETFAFLHEFATDLVIDRVDASHWMPRSHPTEFAAAVREHAQRVERRAPSTTREGRV